MSVAEGIHWMKTVFSIFKKSEREKIKNELPESFQWLAGCRKSETAACLLKVFLDTAVESNTLKILFWPQQCGCNVACDFCVYGNSALVATLLTPLLLEHFDLNFVAWWKRHVRFTTPRTFTFDSQKTYYCFTLLEKPSFFKSDLVFSLPSHVLQLSEQASTLQQQEREQKQEEQEHEKKAPEAPSPHQQLPIINAKARVEYRCKICGLPKKGHVCRGLAPPPLPLEPEPLQQPIPIPPPLLQQQQQLCDVTKNDTKTTRADFDTIFAEERDESTTTRLERLFGAKRQRLSTVDTEKEHISTDIDLFDE